MKLSSKSRYAVMVMMYLALHDHQGPIALAEISATQHISLSYLEQLFGGLREAGLVEGVRGPGGGYRLKRLPDQITIAEIVRIVNEDSGFQRQKPQEIPGQKHLTHALWGDLSQRIEDFLESLTLADFTDAFQTRTPLVRQSSLSQHINSMFPASASLGM